MIRISSALITDTHIANRTTTQYIQMYLDVTRCVTVTLYGIITVKLNLLPLVDKSMEDSNSITYIHRTTVNQEKITPTSEMNTRISFNKDRNEIHPGLRACKLENQDESPTNLTMDSSIFFNYGRVTL